MPGVRQQKCVSQWTVDTLVLLGFVKSAEHLDWIVSNGKYNLGADNRTGKISLGAKALACDLVLLSCPEENKVMLANVEGEPEIKTQNDMLELGYRELEKLYYCLTIELLAEEEWLGTLNPEAIEDIRGQFNPIVGYPVTISWLSFVERLKE
jgi:hypothetical protein